VIRFRVGQIGNVESAKRGFFDRKRVLDATDRATRRVLSRFGAFVRQRDRTSQRRDKKVSDPGSPPSAHVGFVRDFTFFAYDDASRSVVIGPAKLNRPGAVLPLLEEGGEATIKRHGKDARAFYRPRPHTKPAFDIELAKMPPDWRDSIK
jgi:hypothetical protein